MSANSRIELELVEDHLSIETVFVLLAKGSWVDENDYGCIKSATSIEFSEGFQESVFKLSIGNGKLVIESDSPWEMELLVGELKEIAIKSRNIETITNT